MSLFIRFQRYKKRKAKSQTLDALVCVDRTPELRHHRIDSKPTIDKRLFIYNFAKSFITLVTSLMKRFKSRSFFKYLVLLFSIAYVLVSFANMLFIPRYTAAASQAVIGFRNSKSSACTDFRTINFSQVFDRSTLDNDEFNLARIAIKSILLIFTAIALPNPKTAANSLFSSWFCKRPHPCIAFCTLRI